MRSVYVSTDLFGNQTKVSTRKRKRRTQSRDKDRQRAYLASYRADNKERESSLRKAWYAANRPHAIEANKAWRAKNQHVELYRYARRRAKKHNLEFTISPDDIVIPETCPLLGIKLIKGVGKLTKSSPSVDRIDPRRGYVRGNIAVISFRANTMKSDIDAEFLLRLAEYMGTTLQQHN